MTASSTGDARTLFGHPVGLFTLFFAEMWERFSYYGMRALLVFYMIKGFLGYSDDRAYGVYGAYTGLVYATPFIGGMLADRLLGPRRAVVFGGLLMAAGHLLMTIEQPAAFFTALALLITGNGFFKPNISTMVGALYPRNSPRHDAGFTIFYMGVNLGAALSPVLCGYVGETYGWHYGFGLATAGMLSGVAIFVAPTRITQLLIGFGALSTAIAMPFLQDSLLQLLVRLFLGLSLVVSAAAALVALGRGGVPEAAGAPPDPERLRRKLFGILRTDLAVYLGALSMVPVFALLVQRNLIVGGILTVLGLIALAMLILDSLRSEKVERERLWYVLVLTSFSILFWAFYEQAGSSMNNFTDRNVDRVFEARRLEPKDVGTTLPKLRLTQEQLGYRFEGKILTLDALQALREKASAERVDVQLGRKPAPERYADEIDWTVTPDQVGMAVGGSEIPASEFQAANSIYILLLGLALTALWGFLGARGIEPSTVIKFALGLVQLGLGFLVLWLGASSADARGMVGMSWLLAAILLHTTGELCLSPVGLSMITQLSPKRIVSTVMGTWFLATAFSSYVAGLIAQLTGVGGEGAEEHVIPPPIETVNIYGTVFGQIAIIAVIAGLVLLALSPLLRRWRHHDQETG